MQIVKISGKPGSGKTELLSIIAAGSLGRNYLAVTGQSTAQGIIQALRGRRDVVVTIDECSQQLLNELERHPSLIGGAGRSGPVSRIYAVVDEPVVVLPRALDSDRGLTIDRDEAIEAIEAAGVQVAG